MMNKKRQKTIFFLNRISRYQAFYFENRDQPRNRRIHSWSESSPFYSIILCLPINMLKCSFMLLAEIILGNQALIFAFFRPSLSFLLSGCGRSRSGLLENCTSALDPPQRQEGPEVSDEEAGERKKQGKRRRKKRGAGLKSLIGAAQALSAPPVTRLKIKIKIKCAGGSRAAAIAPPSMKRGCGGDNWLNITNPLTAASRKERRYFQEAGQRRRPRRPDNIRVKSARVCQYVNQDKRDYLLRDTRAHNPRSERRCIHASPCLAEEACAAAPPPRQSHGGTCDGENVLRWRSDRGGNSQMSGRRNGRAARQDRAHPRRRRAEEAIKRPACTSPAPPPDGEASHSP